MSIINKLIQYRTTVDLNVRYKWAIPKTCPINIPPHLPNEFQRNVYLKQNLSPMNPVKNFWAIQDWGGIQTFRKNPANNQRITNFLNSCNNGINLQKAQFNIISSLSKVASFTDPHRFFIYDSRVIFSLNWLNLAHGSPKIWYKQPAGRNATLNKYNLETILNLSDINVVAIPDGQAYLHYCDFILSHYRQVGYTDPWELEMLLFVIADEEIIDDINFQTSISMPKSVNWLIKNHSRISIQSTPEGLTVDGDVNLSNLGLTEIPYKFHQVSGRFDISSNCLTSFKNCPQTVGSFDCSYNPYLSDDGDGLPKKITGNGNNLFVARNNKSLAESLLISQEGVNKLWNIAKADEICNIFSGVGQESLDKLQDKWKYKRLAKKLPELEGLLE